MYPEHACNLLEALPQPPWKEELNWGLLITRQWEKRILFSSYVRPDTTTTNGFRGQATSFPQFSILADELQLRILKACPVSTLFQLMQVSSVLRTEASKLFWANPSAYFLVDAYWLLDGGYPGYQCCDLAFLHNLQNIEIQYEPSTNNDIWPRLDGKTVARQDRITTFWASIKRRFPQVKRVIINQNGEPGVWRSDHAIPPPLQALAQACPHTIEVSVLALERQPLPNANRAEIPPTQIWQRARYQFTGNQIRGKVGSRHGETVIVPMKQFQGLVGRFEVLKHKCLRIQLQQYGLWPLAIEALDRHYFDGGRNKPFTCPLPECNAYFIRAGAWSAHAAAVHYQHSGQFSMLPHEIRGLWEEHARSLQEKIGQAQTQFNMIKEEWDNAGQDERSEIQHIWAEQVESDKVWDVAGEQERASDNQIWKGFVEWASGCDY